MYPILFEFFGFPISTFGVMMAVGFLVSAWIVSRRLGEYGLDPEFSSTILIYAMIGGVLGSKLYFAIDESLRSGHPFFDLLLSRAGITWYGGLIGGTLLVALATRFHGLSTRIVASCVATAAPFGQACGRIGCFLVGDDYGVPSTLPWAVAFPEGLPPTTTPVHPTQLYETLALLPLAWLLVRLRRHGRSDGFVLGTYLVSTGLIRFAIEFLRWRQPIIGPLAVAHVAALVAIVIGVALLYASRADARRPASRATNPR
jgi:phosphatidylglycerol---prolipoprotein diacylglyceryl transferase